MGPVEKDIEACVNTETLEKETSKNEICLRIFDYVILLLSTGICVYTCFQLKESIDESNRVDMKMLELMENTY